MIGPIGVSHTGRSFGVEREPPASPPHPDAAAPTARTTKATSGLTRTTPAHPARFLAAPFDLP